MIQVADTSITIIPTTVEHIRLLIPILREEDLREIDKWGASPFKGIWRAYRSSKECHSCFIGNKIMAIGGIKGSVLGFVGNPWLITSTVVDEYPLVFSSLYRTEIKKMLKSYQVLETWCDSAYTKSLKMMRIIGFKEREFRPCGKDGGLLVRLEMERSV